MLRKLLIFTLLVVPGMLMADTGDIPLSSNFQLNSGKPLDARIRAADLTARNAIAGVQRYDGLLVYQIDTKRTWQLQGDTNTWVDVTNGSSGTVTTATAQQLAYYPNNGIQIAGATNVTTDGSTLTVTGSAVFSNGLSSGAWDIAEGISPGGAVGGQSIWADSTTHTLQVNPNNAGDHAVVLSSITPVTNGLAVWKGYGKMGDMGLPPWAVVPSTFAWTLPYPVALSSSVVITGASTTITAPLSIVGFSTETISNEYFDLSQSSAAVGFIKAGVTYGIAGQVLTSGGSTSSATWTTPSSGAAGLLAVGVDTGSIRSSLNSEISAVGTDTTTLKSNILSVGLDTATLKTGFVSVGVDTASLKTGLVAVGVDTASLKTGLVAVGVDTATLKTGLVSVGVATATLKTELVAIGVDTASLKIGLVAVGVDTASLKTGLVAVGVDTATLATGVGTQTSTWTVTGNLSMRGGIYVSTWTSNGTGGVVTSAYTTGPTDSVIYSSASAGGFTITLTTASNVVNQVLIIRKVDASTQTVTVRTTGPGSGDMIDGTTQQFILNTIGQRGEIQANGTGWWSHGHGIDFTPTTIRNFFGGTGNFFGVSSTVYTCAVDVPLPVSVMGFRYTGQVVPGGRTLTFSIYDFRGNLVASTGPVTAIASLNTVSFGSSFVNLAPGSYSIGVQGNQTDLGLNASPTAAANAFCEATAATTMAAPSSINLTSGSSTAREFSISLILSGGRTGE